MGSSDFTTILTLGFVAVGGYLFITQIYPMMKRGIEDAFEEEERIPPTIITPPSIEDRYPDILVEDRYPDYVIENRYPDVVQYPYYPIITPPYCGPGRFWDGFKCKKVDCPPGMKWDDGRCRPDCPAGFRYDDGICKPRQCDDDEYFDGRKCREIPNYRQKKGSRDWKHRERNMKDWDREPRRFENNGNSRDRWHKDRDKEDKVKDAIDSITKPIKELIEPSDKPEQNRVKEIQEKAMQSFLEVDYLY
jgi:hypothetical protein